MKLIIKHISLEPFLSLSPVFAVFVVFAVPLLWLAGLLLLDDAIMGGGYKKILKYIQSKTGVKYK